MFSLIKQVVIVSLRLSESLARDRRQGLFLNNELSMVRSTLIDLNPVEVKYYSFIINKLMY